MAVTPLLHHNSPLLNNSKPSPKPPLTHFLSSSYHSSSSSSSFLLSSINYSPLTSSSFSSSSCPAVSQPSPPCLRVSTAPVEYASGPAPEFDFHLELARLKALGSNLSNSTSLPDKLQVLDSDSRVRFFFNSASGKNELFRFFESLKLDDYPVYLLKCAVAAGQEHLLRGDDFDESGDFDSPSSSSASALKRALYALAEMVDSWDVTGESNKVGLANKILGHGEEDVNAFKLLLKTLGDVEQFYDCIGGIIGYQIMVLELLAHSTCEEKAVNWSQHNKSSLQCQFIEIHPPKVLDLSQDTEYASQAALWGIEGLPELGEIYPFGGSADRLGLVDPDTGECLPAAMLPYCGRTLLEGLIRDLQAREFLFFKLYGKQCITPVAIMTSSAKKNHERILSLCERLEWFGRGRSNFRLFEQPLVPAIRAEDGQWIVRGQFMPVCKPGGHGVIWKLAYDKGVFQWFGNYGRKGATVRQVSNVVAATDLTLLALTGIGLRQRKKLGFASCRRNTGATEGINVLIEKRTLDDNWAYGLSCIEYTEFDKFGFINGPLSSKSLEADFPANTNILYVDLPSAELVGSSKNETSLPGMVLNVKKPVRYVDQFGMTHSVSGGRLECTMQNIADNFLNTYSSRHYEDVEEGLDTFIVYNERRKVTSSAKKKRMHGNKSLNQTPEGSILDIMRNAADLLSHCQISIPKILGNEDYVDSGPPFLILLHPALGPLWEVTRQKFHGGSISVGSELQVEVAEFLWRDVQLHGSLIILAENIMGSMIINENGETLLQYGKRCGRCKLENVKVVNEGIDWNSGDNLYWKHDVDRIEAVKVILHGNAEFEAMDVTLQGDHLFEVPDGYRMRVTSGKSGLQVQLRAIEEKWVESGSWFWSYKIEGTHIQLELVEL
ncbi:UTP--glucose-1-phosphate uridylyltransferase 3, chloroplastic [Coffea eugenioides]|uniref:UTP--glucose-1-phosphate uridylyltransferase 3, chloroplastic n=2 Tax=Coffea eugenioides TaxID=49369 RepID=UPI000F6141DD|nr:UTP--glucose-1-phosphate uridylyltransferase 3, chloroplastic [Coffea eugenioides]